MQIVPTGVSLADWELDMCWPPGAAQNMAGVSNAVLTGTAVELLLILTTYQASNPTCAQITCSGSLIYLEKVKDVF